MKLPRILAAVAVAAAVLVPSGVASASDQEHKWASTFGTENWSWIYWTGNVPAYVTVESMQVQNLNEPNDAFTIQICSIANCENYGPVELGYEDAWLQGDTINEYVGGPGYIVTYTACEFDIGCTSDQMNPWGRN